MKSALANVGESDASQLAFALEKAGLNGDRDFIHVKTEAFIKELEALIKNIPAPAETAAAEDARISEDTAYLAEQLQIIQSASENYDNIAIYAAVGRLKENSWKRETAEAIEGIRETIFLHSDFEDAAARAKRMLEAI
jgi:hypothetical protein